MSKKPVVIQGAKGDEPRTPVEHPNTLKSVALARILDLVSEGEIEGLVDGMKSIYLDETPIQNENGSLNFSNIQVDWRHGTQSQTYIEGFPSVESELGINVELKATTPYERTINNTNVNAVRVRLSVPQLHKTNKENGDISGTSVSYSIQVSTDGGPFRTEVTSSFNGKTMSKYERDHRIDLDPATTGWTVRVLRWTPEASDSSVQNQTFVESMTEIIDAKLRYPNAALIGISMDASQFQNIPSRAYDLKGRIIRVPSNYDPITRAYTGVWDGTYKPAWTDNPAWIYLDLITHKRYGLGHLLEDQHVNKWQLYRIAQYCDQLVPDGRGGFEPRFTCNLYLQKQAEAYKVIQDLATVFRGIAYWANGEIVPVSDMPDDPVYTYTPANVVDGKFVYQGTSAKTRYTVALVSWSDQSNFGRQVVEYVDDPDGINRYGLIETDLSAIGCTSQAQAQRVGRYALITSNYSTQTVSFTVGLDGTLVAPGKIIRIADPLRAAKRLGGRIKTVVDEGTIVLDKAPDIAVESGDTLTIIKSNGVSETRSVFAANGAEISVAPAFSEEPTVGTVWAIDKPSLQTQRFRVISVTEENGEGGTTYTINAVQHNESKFASIDNDTRIDEPQISPVAPPTQEAPAWVQLSHYESASEITTSNVLTIAWPQTRFATQYEVEYRRDDGEWVKLPRTPSQTVDVRDAWEGTYVARVTAINVNGVASAGRLSDPYEVAPLTLKPGVIVDLETGQQINFDAIAAEELARIAADAQEAANRAQAILDEETARAAAILDEANARTTAINTAVDTLRGEADTLRTDTEASVAAVQDQVDELSGEVDGLVAQVGDIMMADEWVITEAYEIGEIVKHVGKLYRALMAVPVNTQPDTNPSYWQLIGNYASLGEAVGATVGRVNAHDTTLTELDGDINAVASDLSALSIVVDGKATNTALNQLTTRVSEAEGTLTSQGSSITALQNTLNDGTTGLATKASASAVSALETRVTETEGDISTQSSAITSLQNTINHPSTGLASKASSEALSALSTRVDGIDSTAVDLTALTTRMDTVESSLVQEMITSSQKDSALTSSVNLLDQKMEDAEGNILAANSAISGLTNRMTTAEGTISSTSSQLTSLQAQVNAIDADTGGAGQAIADLDTRVTANEGTINSQGQAITALQNSVTSANKVFIQDAQPSTTGRTNGDLWIDSNDNNKLYGFTNGAWVLRQDNGKNTIFVQSTTPVAKAINDLWFDTSRNNRQFRWNGSAWVEVTDTRIAANASAITSLTTRVTNAEGINTSQGEAITNLQNTVNNTTTGVTATANALSSLTTRVTNTETTNTSQGSAITALQNTVNNATTGVSATASALSALTTRVTNTENTNTSQGSAITSLQNTVNNSTTGVTATANALSALTTRVTNAENTNTSQGSAITSLQNTVNNSTTGVTATANAVSSLTTRVTNAEGTLSSHSSSISTLTTSVGNHTTTINSHASSINGLRGKVGVTIDANGYITGWEMNNDGSSGTMTIVADKFRIVTPGQTPKTPFAVQSGNVYVNTDLYMGAGRIVSQGGGYMKVQGTGFGVGSEFIEWYGPQMAITSCSRANAVYYLTNDGDAYFGGSLSAGVFKNSATSTQIGGGAIAEIGNFSTNGKSKVVTFTFIYTNAGYHPTNLGNATITATVVLERSYNGGAWTQISSRAMSGSRAMTEYEPGLGYWHQISISGASTFTDSYAGTGTFNYRVRISASSGWPSTLGSKPGSQKLSVTSIEE